MSDKNMIEEINVSKCKYFNNGWCKDDSLS